MKKILVMIMIAMMAFGIVACGSEPLSSDFDEEKLTARVDEIIQTINDNDKEKLIGFCGEEVKKVLTDQIVEQIFTDINGYGEFDKINKINFAENKTEEDQRYVTAVVQTIYKDKKCIYTISLDLDMEMVGLFYK